MALPAVVNGMPACLQAVVATATMIEKSIPIVLDHPCAVTVPHAVMLLFNSAATQHFTATRRTGYEVILLSHPKYTYQRSPAINSATFVPLPQEGCDHDCLLFVEVTATPRLH